MRYFILSIGAILLALSGCHESPYPGYSWFQHGIYYKLIALGENSNKADYGDYITVDISYKTMEDSVFFQGRRKFQMSKPDYEGSVDECFTMLAEGDKASFIISAPDFFNKTLETKIPHFLQNDSTMKVDIKMLEVQTQKQYQQEKKAFLRWVKDFGDYEEILLKQYLDEHQIDKEPTRAGYYYIQLKPGNGEQISKGDTITIHYEGKFLNGKFFDSTRKREQPFEFVYGSEWQVIEGLEKALGRMREGEKALVILPSELAFGKEGSSTGIVPPFTSLIYELEVIHIR